MNCNEFRMNLDAGHETVEQLAHQRECADCLELAISREPSAMFSTMGTEDLLPPEGIEAFVSSVMNEVRLRETEKTLEKNDHPVKVAWWWAAAAAVFITFTTWLAIQPRMSTEPVRERAAIVADAGIASQTAEAPSMTLPVIDDYDKVEATIVELPSDSVDDLKIVMIFDESLPQDL